MQLDQLFINSSALRISPPSETADATSFNAFIDRANDLCARTVLKINGNADPGAEQVANQVVLQNTDALERAGKPNAGRAEIIADILEHTTAQADAYNSQIQAAIDAERNRTCFAGLPPADAKFLGAANDTTAPSAELLTVLKNTPDGLRKTA